MIIDMDYIKEKHRGVRTEMVNLVRLEKRKKYMIINNIFKTLNHEFGKNIGIIIITIIISLYFTNIVKIDGQIIPFFLLLVPIYINFYNRKLYIPFSLDFILYNTSRVYFHSKNHKMNHILPNKKKNLIYLVYIKKNIIKLFRKVNYKLANVEELK
ncbi:MAG: hypothetical protein ACTSRP_15080 [Candidatus Helarchaeota archaeon]